MDVPVYHNRQLSGKMPSQLSSRLSNQRCTEEQPRSAKYLRHVELRSLVPLKARMRRRKPSTAFSSVVQELQIDFSFYDANHSTFLSWLDCRV